MCQENQDTAKLEKEGNCSISKRLKTRKKIGLIRRFFADMRVKELRT
jgi:hypothetical protein